MKTYRREALLLTLAVLVGAFLSSTCYGQRSRPIANQARYLTRENVAPALIKQTLATLRTEIQAKRLTFKVGYTSALDRPLEQITGLVRPPNWQANIPVQNAIANKALIAHKTALDEFKRKFPEKDSRGAARAETY